MWSKDDERVVKIRGMGYKPNRSFETYVFCFKHPELAANAIICLVHQADYLLDRQLGRLEKDFLEGGGFIERLYNQRRKIRGY